MGEQSAAVLVSGLGVVSPLGRGCDRLWEALLEGKNGIGPVEHRFDTTCFTAHLAATVPQSVPLERAPDPCSALALTAATEAWQDAGLDRAPPDLDRVAVVLGTSLGWHTDGLHRFAEILADHFGIRGPRLTLSSACISSSQALGVARDLIRSGEADLVLAGGTDLLSPELFAGFHALGVMSAAPCAPFSTPTGLTLGEGAGIAVVESAPHAAERGATPWARFCGYGLAADAYHATSPEPQGAGVARALRAALADAGASPAQVDYVNMHGTGTEANDRAEWLALTAVFAGLPERPVVSASKSFLGHAQGAAGILEIIVTLVCGRHGAVPPTRGFRGPRPGGPSDPVAQPVPRPLPWTLGVSLNSAFGGANAAVVLAPPTAPAPPPTPLPDRAVRVAGLGAVGPHGTSLVELVAPRRPEARTLRGTVPPYRLERIVRGVDPRGLDPLTRHLIAAAALALEDAGLRVRGALRDRAGLVVGTPRLSPTSAHDFAESIERRGLARLSAAAFSRMVLNAPAGACSRALSLRGPNSTLTVGPGSGLVALWQAARLLRHRDDADVILAAGMDESLQPHQAALLSRLGANRAASATRDDRGSPPPTSEGAGCLVLTAEGAPGVYVAGGGLAGPDQADRAVTRALAQAKRRLEDVDRSYGWVPPGGALPKRLRTTPHPPTPDLGYAPAATSLWSAIQAVWALRRGEVTTALVLAREGCSVTAAVVLERRETP